jgi:hypothetical protein
MLFLLSVCSTVCDTYNLKHTHKIKTPCTCVCMHVHTRMGDQIGVHACVRTLMGGQIGVHTLMGGQIGVHTCVRAHTWVAGYVHACTHACVAR